MISLEDYEFEFADLDELKSRFKRKREKAELLSQSFYRIGYDKRAQATLDCGTQLSFHHDHDAFGSPDPHGKLYRANFCRDKLCPMCNWRRSVKTFYQVSQVLDVIQDKYKFLFLTLTVVNPVGAELRNTIDRMSKGWNNFTGWPFFKKAVRGYVRTLEVTYNAKEDTYHPHYHVLLAVPKCYFKSGTYVDHDIWLNAWRDCYGDQEIQFVNIQRIKEKWDSRDAEQNFKEQDVISQKESASEAARYGAFVGAVLEVTKYALKDADYIFESWRKTDTVVSVLSSELKNVRMISFGGIFQEVRRQLGCDDPESGDLVHVEGKQLNSITKSLIMVYEWQIGAYCLVDSYVGELYPERRKDL